MTITLSKRGSFLAIFTIIVAGFASGSTTTTTTTKLPTTTTTDSSTTTTTNYPSTTTTRIPPTVPQTTTTILSHDNITQQHLSTTTSPATESTTTTTQTTLTGSSPIPTTLTSDNPVKQQQCLEGWAYYNQDQTCLKLFDDRATWQQAREFCKAFDGDLVVIRDENKNDFVYSLSSGVQYVWIGTKNIAIHGYDYQNVDESDLGAYHPWSPRDPRGDGIPNWKCVRLNLQVGKIWWVNYSCTSPAPYVCSTSARVLPLPQ